MLLISKKCSKCKLVKDESEFNKDFSRKDGLYSSCKKCTRKYNSSEAGKERHRKYWASKKGKIVRKRKDKKYSQSKKGKKTKKRVAKKYRQSERGKKAARKVHAKRKRQLGYNELYINAFPEMVVDWHHINDTDVVAIPRTLHRRFAGHIREKHRKLLEPYVKMFYGVTE